MTFSKRTFPRSARLMKNFSGAESGAVMIMFALLIPVLLVFSGLAIDYASMLRIRDRAQQISDAASLAGVSAARELLLKNGLGNSRAKEESLKAAKATAEAYFKTQAASRLGIDLEAKVKVTSKQRAVKAEVSFSTAYKPHFGGLFGVTTVPISGLSVAEAGTVPYIEVTLMVDTSGSMAIGADADQQELLRSKLGCAFACHDGVPTHGYPDAYAYALGQGITLRYQAVNDGIKKLIDEFDNLDPDEDSIKAEIWSFNTTEKQMQNMTSSRSKLRWNLPSAPATSGETEGATHFNEAIAKIAKQIGKGGDGSTPGHPIKLLIIATDGVQDPGRFWTWNVGYRDEVGAFDTSFCDQLKSKDVKIGIIHTPYLPMTYDWGYNATLGQPGRVVKNGTRGDDVPVVLKACAGERYVLASDTQSIVSGFVDILKSVTRPHQTM